MADKPRTLKVIDLNEKSFTANGKEYFIETGLSVDRYLKYQLLQIEVGYEVSFIGIYEKVKKIFELCDKMQFAQIAVLASNIINGISKIETRKLPVLQLCALFINETNEDRTIITDEMVDKKLADWEAEGLDITPFFSIAVNSIQGFATAYQQISLGILNNVLSNQTKTNLSTLKSNSNGQSK